MLSASQKLSIRGYLGLSLVAALPEVAAVLDVVDGDIQTQVETVLTSLADLDSRLASTARDTAGLTSVSSVSLATGQTIDDLRNLASAEVVKLSNSLGIGIHANPYSGGRTQNFQFYGV